MYSRHIEVEDRRVFPLAARVLDARQISELGQEMAERRGLSVRTESPGAKAKPDLPPAPIDIPAAIAKLRAKPAVDGRRQAALSKQAGMTVVLFAFNRGARMPEHKANGAVCLHVLRGQIQVTVAGRPHDLREGHMLMLMAGELHALAAEADTDMIATIHAA